MNDRYRSRATCGLFREVLAALLLVLLAPLVACPGDDVAFPPPPPGEQAEEITMEDSVQSVPHSARMCVTDCLSCHATGVNGAPPQAHPGRTECVLCHVGVDPSDATP